MVDGYDGYRGVTSFPFELIKQVVGQRIIEIIGDNKISGGEADWTKGLCQRPNLRNSPIVSKHYDCLTFEDSVKVFARMFLHFVDGNVHRKGDSNAAQTFYGEFRLTMPIAR